MKRKLIVFILLATVALAHSANAQSKNLSAHPYYLTKGYGVEVGTWPAKDGSFGVFGGVTNTTNGDGGKDFVMYGKAQFRSSKYVHATAAMGLADLNSLYAALGLRLSYPAAIKKQSIAFVLEPQLTSLGFKTSAGAVFTFKK